MAVVAKLYTNVYVKAFNKEINFGSDNIKVMLCTSAYVPNQDTHIYKSSVTNEVVGTGYTAGGLLLGSKTITVNPATHGVTFDAADSTWAASTIAANIAVIYDDTGVAATSPLISYIDFGGTVSSSGGPFTITYDVSGIIVVTAS